MVIKRNPGHRGDPMFLADVLRAFGVTVKEFDAWKLRGHGDFNIIWGVMAHHTGGMNAPASSIVYGRPDLKGPLSQIHLDRNAVATMTCVGIAWHAGRGSYPGIQTNNANAVTIGIEANSDGKTPWPAPMLDAYYRICAAICWYLGLPSSRVIGHKEWSHDGKWDPGGIDMNDFRRRVQHYINNPPFATKAPESPVTEAGEPMSFWQTKVPSLLDSKKQIARQDFIQLIDYHSALANIQSKQTLDKMDQTLAEMKLVREDMQALARLVVDTTGGK